MMFTQSKLFPFTSRRRNTPSINLAPLIDMLFLLLICLALTTTFKLQPGLKIDLPVAKHADSVRTDTVTLWIGANQEFYLEGELVRDGDLRAALQKRCKAVGRQPLVIRVDQAVPSGLLVRVMDMAQEVGFSRIVIPTATPP